MLRKEIAEVVNEFISYLSDAETKKNLHELIVNLNVSRGLSKWALLKKEDGLDSYLAELRQSEEGKKLFLLIEQVSLMIPLNPERLFDRHIEIFLGTGNDHLRGILFLALVDLRDIQLN